MMKLNRYSVSGRSHRKGMAATSCVRCVVTARSRTEALAARPNQSRRTDQPGSESAGSWLSGTAAPESWGRVEARHAVTAQNAAKQTYAADHPRPCILVGRLGSISRG